MSRPATSPVSEVLTLDTFLKTPGRGKRGPSLVEPGIKTGRLTASDEFCWSPRPNGRQRAAQKFTCDCGTSVWVFPGSVKRGNTSSCGCLHTEVVKTQKILVTRVRDGKVQEFLRDRNHGESKTRLYRKWKSMHSRCSNPNNRVWRWYGGKGVSVSPEWSEWTNFRDWAHNTGYAEGLELDRVDADKDYSPGNCRWITKRENVKRARSLLPPEVNDLLTDDALSRDIDVDSLVAEIVINHYWTAEEVRAQRTSRKPAGSVTDGEGV